MYTTVSQFSHNDHMENGEKLTTRSSQHAVEESFLENPRNISSVPTCCLNIISYLKKKGGGVGIDTETQKKEQFSHKEKKTRNL